MGGSNDCFAKTICSICYEDLKPIVEDLQAISICGHVFHELCLQQWFGYCKDSKKKSCPVCKQGCTDKNVGRLYFQSVGDSVLTQSQIPVGFRDAGDCPEVLRLEVKRLENKVAGLASSLDQQQKEAQQLTTELRTCKAKLSKEVTLKNEALKQKECIQLKLQTKSDDLDKTTSECSRLEKENIELAKEIALLKVASDCNLDEDEIVKLASLGNDSNSRDVIDVLKKSLAIRNKSYKDLMAKCNALGRGENRSLNNLKKAEEKIINLKTRIRELEKDIETRDNEALRNLKESKKRHLGDFKSSGADKTTNSEIMFNHNQSEEKSQYPPCVINLDDDVNSAKLKKMTRNVFSVNKSNTDKVTVPFKETSQFECFTDSEDEQQKSATTAKPDLGSNKGSSQETGSSRRVDSDIREVNHAAKDNSFSKNFPGLSPHDIRHVQPSPILLAEPGDRCFSAGLHRPDGANMYLGKWCKRAPKKGNAANGLISVGADGRGGIIKVLNSTNQTSTDAQGSTVTSKKQKTVPKSSSLTSSGRLQIEHFFGKASN